MVARSQSSPSSIARAQPAASPGRNYLFLLLGGIFIIALAVILATAFSSFSPLEGCVGVVQISGEIVSTDIPATVFSDEVKGSETIAGEIASADARQDVKSVLVIIDSPGGSVVGSKEIYDAIRALNKSSVAYINEMAASGGYYAASGTDYIIAQPDALTGNIGARATIADMSGLFEKIGYNETTIKSGAMKDMGSSSRPMTPDERAVFESIINESFQQFKSDVQAGRGSRLDKESFATVLDARIMSGRQAKRIGLVDQLGNKKAAILRAAELGGISSKDPALCELSSSNAKKGLLGSLSAEAVDFLVKSSGIPRLSYR
jgi:protease IV